MDDATTYESIRLEVDTTKVGGIETLNLSYSSRNFSAGFTMTFLNTPAMDWLQPFQYNEIRLFYVKDGIEELLITGRIEKLDKGIDQKIKIEGRCRTAFLVDSSLLPPFQYQNVSLDTMAMDILAPFNIGVENEIENLPIRPSIRATVGDSIFKFLNQQAEQEGILLAASAEGNLRLHHLPAGVVELIINDTNRQYLGASASFNGAARFSELHLIAQSESSVDLSYVLVDDEIVGYRPLLDVVEADDMATLEAIAQRRLFLARSNSMKLSFNLHGWPRGIASGKLLMPGDVVQHEDATLGLKRELWRIEAVNRSLAPNNLSTSLSLVLIADGELS